jgi:hypothetical protein
MTEKLDTLVGRASELPAKFENFQRFPNELISLSLL